MSVCLDYQSVYRCKNRIVISARMQICTVLVLMLAVGAKVFVQISCTNAGYQLAKERERTLALDLERRELELQRSVILKADTLAKAANRRLGLKTLRPEQARTIRY